MNLLKKPRLINYNQKKKKKKKKNKYQKMTEKNVTLKQMQQQIRQQ